MQGKAALWEIDDPLPGKNIDHEDHEYEEDTGPWDDRILVNAYLDAIKKYKAMHLSARTSSKDPYTDQNQSANRKNPTSKNRDKTKEESTKPSEKNFNLTEAKEELDNDDIEKDTEKVSEQKGEKKASLIDNQPKEGEGQDLVGQTIMRLFQGTWFEAYILEYDAGSGEHCLIYGYGSGNETWERLCLKKLPQEELCFPLEDPLDLSAGAEVGGVKPATREEVESGFASHGTHTSFEVSHQDRSFAAPPPPFSDLPSSTAWKQYQAASQAYYRSKTAGTAHMQDGNLALYNSIYTDGDVERTAVIPQKHFPPYPPYHTHTPSQRKAHGKAEEGNITHHAEMSIAHNTKQAVKSEMESHTYPPYIPQTLSHSLPPPPSPRPPHFQTPYPQRLYNPPLASAYQPPPPSPPVYHPNGSYFPPPPPPPLYHPHLSPYPCHRPPHNGNPASYTLDSSFHPPHYARLSVGNMRDSSEIPSPELLAGMNETEISNLLMAWYYAGYYTGKYARAI